MGAGAIRQQRIRFNVAHAGARSCVERAFGALKSRFPSLKCLPGRHPKLFYREILALMTLGNWLRDMGDNLYDLPNIQAEDRVMLQEAEHANPDVGRGQMGLNRGDQNGDQEETAAMLKRKGWALREDIVNEYFAEA